MCNALPAALGHLRRNTGLLGLIGAACVLAGHAAAAPAPALFRLTVTGTANHEWSYTAAPQENGNCTKTEMTEGIRTTRFRTKEPVVVRLVAGRVLAADLRVVGTVTLGGANTTDERCGDVGTGRIADCAQTARSFSGGRVRVSSPRPGTLDLGPARSVRLRESDCPSEPIEVIRRPLGPVMSPLRMPKEALTAEKVASITMRATRSATTSYAAPEDGRLQERVEWKLTFIRIKP